MLGVKIFFVLSGYLITSILIADRETTSPPTRIAASFFYRRALRLWPAYAVAIAAAAALGIAGMRDDWLIHSLYLSNFMVAFDGQWSGASHFWTLSVEEQFYLLLFPLVVVAPRKWLVPVIVAALVIAPAVRTVISMGASEFYAVLLPAQIDSFAMGSLTAVASSRPALAWLDQALLRPMIRGTLLLGVFLLSFPLPEHWQSPFLSWVILPIIVNLAAASVVRACVSGARDITRWLEHPSLIYIGKISYGLYVYHYFVPQVITPERLGLSGLDPTLQVIGLAILWTGVSFAIADLSFRFMERPILRLKGRPLSTPDPSKA